MARTWIDEVGGRGVALIAVTLLAAAACGDDEIAPDPSSSGSSSSSSSDASSSSSSVSGVGGMASGGMGGMGNGGAGGGGCQPNETLCGNQCLVLDALCGCPGDTNVSFSGDIQPLINTRCTNCHTNGGTSGGLNLDSAYSKIVNVQSACLTRNYVDPFNPSVSHIYNKTSGMNIGCGSMMPLSGGPLSMAQMSLIRDWICQGAPNN